MSGRPDATIVRAGLLLAALGASSLVQRTASAQTTAGVSDPGEARAARRLALPARAKRHLLHLVGARPVLAGADTAYPPARTLVCAGAALTYYVDSMVGNDRNPGTTPAQPWQSIRRVNRGAYCAGDGILFHAGQSFAGKLRFTPVNSAGAAAAPITVSSYGGGRATLLGGRRSGLVAQNVAGFHITDLTFVGTRPRCSGGHTHGILFETHNTNTTLSGIAIDQVEVGGFCEGITVGSDDDASRFADVRITDVVVHDNGDAGINTFDPALAHHDIVNVYVARARTYNNADTGGIVLFGVNGGTVEYSVAYNNGARGSGSVGIWAFDANAITIQDNESYANQTVADDGDGFDLDGGVSNSVMQYNYAHDNVGIGFLICGCVDFYRMSNNVVRYNISENDGATGQPSAIYMLGGEPFDGLEIDQNTVYSNAGAGPLVLIDGGGSPYSHVHLRNNILVTDAGKTLLQVPDPQDGSDLTFQGNDYWARDGRLTIAWGASMYVDVGAWRSATGQETLNGGSVGFAVDPGLCNIGNGGTVDPSSRTTLPAYKLQSTSPLIDVGLDLPQLFGIDVGPHDFYDNPIPVGRTYDVGADEFQAGQGCR